MRESQMKKIIAAAVATAFVVPAFAADVTITGDQGFFYVNGETETTAVLNGDVNIKASTETSNGLSVSADFNFGCGTGGTCEAGYADGDTQDGWWREGSNSLTVAGPFGKVDMGDTSNAVDAIDDTTDFGYYASQGVGGSDAGILWTLPTLVDGLTVNVSHDADNNSQGGGGAGTGASARYSTNGIVVGYGNVDLDDGSQQKIVNAAYSMMGVRVAYEQLTETDEDGVETDNTNVGATYSTGPITLAYENAEITSEGDKSADVTAYGLHYDLGGGVTAFIEQLSVDVDTEDDLVMLRAVAAYLMT
jgi:hypothetical protein